MFNSGIHAHHIHQPGGAYHDRIHQQQSTSRGFENYNSARISPPQMTDVVYPTGIGLCSLPIRFECGQFAGKIIRSELCEIQKADLGRKYARVDRRPLDPPPVVTLRFFEVLNEVTSQRERELTFEEIQILGLLCTVDLFPVIDAESHLGSPTGKSGHRKSNSSSTTNSSHYSPISYDSHGYTPGSSVHNLSPTSPTYPIGRPATVSRTHCPGDIVHSVGYNPIIESSKMTDSLVGATFVQPQFIDYEGTRTLIFVFSDLAVKNEGTFLLRYRMFDLFSKAEGHEDRVIQAECYGGTFRVYSTKEFPGLRASTELTKLISRYGIRLNIRETERRRRTKDAHTETPSGTRRGKRKQASFDDQYGGFSEGLEA